MTVAPVLEAAVKEEDEEAAMYAFVHHSALDHA